MTAADDLVLVTGGCGFVGANLVRRLEREGRRVRVVDDLSGGGRETLATCAAEIAVGDIRDGHFMTGALRGVGAVVHLAAMTSLPDSVRDPALTVSTNVDALVGLLKAAADARISKFVLASSNAAVGEASGPVNEELLPRPASPYGASKLAGEAYCWAAQASYGLPVVILRFANVYGRYSLHKNNAVHKFIRLLLAGEAITINGDGQQSRDFIYVDDVCDAVVRSIDSPLVAELFQIGTGVETPLLDVVSILSNLVGGGSRILHGPPATGEVRRSASNPAKARRLLGFAPATKLRDGLATTVSWYRDQVGVGANRLTRATSRE